MSRKKAFVPVFGSSSSHAGGASFRGASLYSTAAVGTSTSMDNPLIRESDEISHTRPVPNNIGETQDPTNAQSSMNSGDSVDSSYAHIKLRRRGGRRSQYVLPSTNKIMPPDGETKPRLWCYGKNSFIPYNASRRIGSIIRDHYKGAYPNWSHTLNDQVMEWWEIFK